MEFPKCFQCNKELPFSVSSKSIKCPFCSAVNETAKPDENTRSSRKSPKRNSDTSILGGIMSGGGGGSSNDGGGGNCDGGGGVC